MASEAATKIADAYDVYCGDPMRPEWRNELAEKIDAAIAAAVQREREATIEAIAAVRRERLQQFDTAIDDRNETLSARLQSDMCVIDECTKAIRNRKEQPDEQA